jgi:RHS repeat-associated protein
LSDHLGTPRQVINLAKQLRWRWDNVDPFGANLPNQNPAGLGAFGYNLRFPGQYFDSETGLHYNYFRDYNPSTGRYIESDPIGLRGGLNTYGYVGGNPVSFVDPLGLDPMGGDQICATDGSQGITCNGGGMSPPPVGTPMNGPLSPVGIAKTVAEAALSALPCPALKINEIVKKAKISTGRTTANNLKENLAMREVKSNPSGTTSPRMPPMSDAKNNLYAADGWVKRTQNVNGVEIHYVENTRTGQTIDFKFK